MKLTVKFFSLVVIVGFLFSCSNISTNSKKVEESYLFDSLKKVEKSELEFTAIDSESSEEEELIIEYVNQNLPVEVKVEEDQKFVEFDPQYEGTELDDKNFNIPSFLLNLDAINEKDPVNLSFSKNNVVFGKAKAKVAVLLPFTGVFSLAAKQIQAGLIKEQFKSSTIFSKLHFVDSNTPLVNEIYQKLASNYDVIIGPLQESQIAKITYSTKVINISLNSMERPQPKTYKLGFNIDDEVDQLLEEASRREYCRVLLIVENNIEGEEITNKISSRWFEQGKIITKVLYLENSLNMSAKMIKTHLYNSDAMVDYEYDESELKSKKAKEEEGFPFIRQDIDVIILAVKTKKTRLIYPIMKLVGGFHIPILSFSLLSKETDFNPRSEKDLRNIHFLDSSWKYEKGVESLFEAIAVDAYKLANAFWRYPRFIYKGYTGEYYYSSRYDELSRRKGWYTVKSSKVVKL